ncbi:oligogalacturonate-specific porin KdgM family protein [Proteus hauseri]
MVFSYQSHITFTPYFEIFTMTVSPFSHNRQTHYRIKLQFNF